jgi:hypothetical protein
MAQTMKAESADVALDVPAFAGALMAARFREPRRGEDVVKLIGKRAAILTVLPRAVCVRNNGAFGLSPVGRLSR